MAGHYLGRSTAWLAGLSLTALAVFGATPASAVDYLNVTVQPDRVVPGACFSFSSALPRGNAAAFDPFVAIEPATDHVVQPRGKDLCVTGLQHGTHYSVRLKSGLPAADGSTLAKDVTVAIDVPDREPVVSFDGSKTLLPYTDGVGLPLRSVNVSKAHIVLYRFGERALADRVGNDWFGQGVSGWAANQIAEQGSKVFEGRVDIVNKANQQVTTALPISQLVKSLLPGVYVALAVPEGKPVEDDTDRATQWFSVSDVGLVTIKTAAGLLISTRSLQTAQPLPDVELRLVAHSSEILTTIRTDAEGRALIPGGLLRGEGGDAPRLLSASTARGDFSWIQLDTPSLDLTDLDIKGRTPPGALDVFLWTDRGVYRPGETIHLGTLLRDGAARLASPTPLVLHLVRPDGVEATQLKPDLARAGGGTLDIPVPDNAYSGEWTIWAGTGTKDRLGSTTVSVQDFVPPRLEAKLSLPDGPMRLGDAISPTIKADYFYGSPGAELSGQIEATIQTAAEPFPDLADYSFGLVQEPFLPKALDAQDFTTDDQGAATVPLPTGDTPDTSGPLELALHATVNDVDGRAATTDLTHALVTADRFIGLRTSFQGGIPENAQAAFDLVLVDGAGHPVGPAGLKWDLVHEDYTYNTFFRDGRWQSEEIVSDARVNGGDLALDANGRGHLSVAVTSGRFRLEAYDESGKTASSVRFTAGWWGNVAADDRKPDVMPVTLDPGAAPGHIRARVEPAFAGRVLVMLDGGSLHQVREADVPKGGGIVEFDAADVPAAGAYVVAIAVSATGAVVPRLPVRAVGLAWVPGATAAHRLDVALDAPEKIQPKTSLSVGITVTGAPKDRPAYVTVAAVDEAVLRMTDFTAPDPADFFLGRRAPDFELRDVYGTLIDPAGQAGRLVEGGDARAKLQLGGVDVKTFKTVALFSGAVELDPDGHGHVALDVPDFSGKLRLMAVAWTADRFGHAERAVTVRPPLLAELTLPRFLTPGDKAQVRVMLTALEAPEQTYKITLSADGPLSFERDDVLFKDVKRDKRRYADRMLTATGALGPAHIHMVATGDDGTKVVRDFDIGVRSPNAYVTTRQIRTLDPDGKLTAGDALGQDLVPGTGTLDVAVATVPAFDVPGLLAELRRYPYGCAEQTVSRAFPELFAATLGGSAAAPVDDAVTGQGAIARLYSLQAQDGSFGYWSAFDSGNIWLTAYVIDFLQHAEKQGLSVPESMKTRAVNWLVGRFATAGQEPQDVAAAAYTAVVLSRAGKLDLSQLRYVATHDRAILPSDLARVQFATVLMRSGERDLASDLLQATAIVRKPNVYLSDYGSDLRDRAMMLSLAAEEKVLPPNALLTQATDLARLASGQAWMSTQEETWVLRSAFDLKTKTPLDILLDGKAIKGQTRASVSTPLGQNRAIEVVNKGHDPVYLSLATTGVPSGPQPRFENGFNLQRDVYHLDGSPADLADVHQNDELVMVLSGKMAGDLQRKVLAVDRLPAGLEPETIGLSGDRDTTKFAWLKDLTEPTFTALRDDRYLAGFDLTQGSQTFKVAYVVRAVTPGTYARPGAQVEDMYVPAYFARTDAGTLDVKAARKP
ncbi:alpha-2-macroglobulin family protein [Lichenifustis flavocetrariae]|uniref:Alpha-2-macroglobulin family protein n=1 Tax=Lichenifustis flavocetrariae TaxID=2949735 RepID=A0AA41YT17_9HYPH|nr:alpha-2-macroglobulin [Lichenifustis flavocetrariae]MCW6506795.1 alpha-2-macroglobulin family protein [Lichenifustis flavocetrariae]